MSVIYEFDFPCGCRTRPFDPRAWILCDGHATSQEAILEWAGYGARAARAIRGLTEPGHTHRFVDRAVMGAESPLHVCACGAVRQKEPT